MTAVAYDVQIDREAIKEALSLFEFLGGNSADALRVAINKTGPKVRTAASKAIRGEVRLTASYVGDKLGFKRATRADLSGAIRTPSRGLLLTKFSDDPAVAAEGVSWIKPPPQPFGGMFVKVKPSGAAKKIGRGAASKPFYVVLKNSRALGIARRLADGKLDVLHGPSLSQVFGNIREDVLPDAGAELQRQMLDAMRYLLVKQYPPED